MICIYGASDDLVEIEGHPDGDEVGCYEKDVFITIGDTTGGGLAVRMSYSPQLGKDVAFGCWTAEIGQLDEDCPIPWPVTITTAKRHPNDPEAGYSVKVAIDAPAGVTLRWFKAPHSRAA